MTHHTYRQHQKKQRGRVLAVQAALGISIAALTAGIGYASLCIVRGQAVLPGLPQALAAWRPFSQSAAASEAAAPGASEGFAAAASDAFAPGAASALQTQTGAARFAGAPAVGQTLSAVWNTPVPLAQSGPPVGDTRLLAVPENGRLSDDYFRDALFIGDSVTQGFGVYPEYKEWMRVCAYKGVGPQGILQNMVGQRPDNTPIEMWDDIKIQQNVANIYVLFGANALLSQSDEAFLKYYGDLLDRLRSQFPDVPIYVQSLTPTTQAYGQKRPALARDHLRTVNEAVAQLAVSRGMYYIDLWEALADGDGYLREDLSGDGLHLHDGSKYRPWLDYLATHTVYSAHNAQFALTEGGAYS